MRPLLAAVLLLGALAVPAAAPEAHALVVLLTRPGGFRPAAPPYRVSGVRALLFYEDRGAFSGDVLADTTRALWNTPIGEGEAGGPSSSTLVVVEVAGEAGSYEPDRSVELTATAGGKTLLRRAVPVGILNRRGRAYAGFWLYGTGCERVRLSARLLGQPAAAPARREIPFECGE